MEFVKKKIVYLEGNEIKAVRGEIPLDWEKTDSEFLTIRWNGGETTVAKKHLVAIKEIVQGGLEGYE